MPPQSLLAAPPSLVEAARRAAAQARAADRPALLAWCVAAPEADALRFLAAQDAPRWFFATPEGEAMAGTGEALRFEGEGAARFDHVRVRAEALLARAVVDAALGAPPPRLLGGFAFADAHRPIGPWEDFPGAWFALPRVAVLQERGQAWVQVHRLVEGREEPEALARHMARQAHDAASPPPLRPAPSGQPLPALGHRVLERAEWAARVAAALEATRRGRLAKVVLARRVAVPLAAPLAGPEALRRLQEPYGDCFRFLLEPRVGRAFLGATPERLVRVRGREVRAAAIAGSAPRGRDAAGDARFAAALLASPKERREHDLVVEHLRAGLADLGAEPQAAQEPEVLRLHNVQHLHTPFQGKMPGPAHAIEVAAALHPTPAVAGTPTRAAMDYLEESEGFARGWYAGAVGWFDARGEGELAVALRCALLAPEEAWLFAGAGIVPGAEAEREWDETALKLEPMLEALGGSP